MTGWMFGLALGIAPAQAQDEPLYMADLGMSVTIPNGFRVPRWSDWDLDGVDKAKTTQVKITSTPFQVEFTEQAAKVWADLAVQDLESGSHTDVNVVSTAITEVDGRVTAVAEIRYRHNGKDAAVLYQRSFLLRGKVAHLRAIGLARNASRVRRALASWDKGITLDKAPLDLADTYGPLVSEAAFESTLPQGWRKPLAVELRPVRELAAKTGQGKIDKERCWVAIKPYPEGDTALLLACQQGAWVGQVDENSFAAKQEQLKELIIGDMDVGPATALPASSDGRLSPMYTLSGSGDLAVRVAVAPYDKGLMVVYAIGKAQDGKELEAALAQVLETTTFTGPDGGPHPVSVLDWIDYALKFRPIFFAPLGLFLVGLLGVFFKLATRKPSYEDID
jgi:hypothetical protein